MHDSTLAALAASRHADLLQAARTDRAGAAALDDARQGARRLAAWLAEHRPRRRADIAPCVSC